MVGNDYAPSITVDPVNGSVTLDGRLLTATPVDEVPLNRRYFLA
jgi:urease alpha subunit